MSLFNFGGPGWFNDVFEVELKLNGDRQAKSKGYLFQESLPLFRADETITGVVKLTPPPNRTVWHYGVTLSLESSIHFFESMRSIELPMSESVTTVQESAPIGEATEIPFELNLAKLKLLDTYDGEIFDVRHAIIITIQRPWYTFNVVRSQAIAVHNCESAPADDNIESVPSAETAEHPGVPRGHILNVVDCGGKCTFDYKRSSYNIGDLLTGTVTVEGLPQPITSLKVKLYKIEKGDGDVYEKILNVKDIIAPKKASAPGEAGAAEAATTPETATAGAVTEAPATPAVDAAAVAASSSQQEQELIRSKPLMEDETISIELPIVSDGDGVLSPTYTELNETSDTVNVHYYLRLELSNADGIPFWNTHEVIIYRSQLTDLAAVEV